VFYNRRFVESGTNRAEERERKNRNYARLFYKSIFTFPEENVSSYCSCKTHHLNAKMFRVIVSTLLCCFKDVLGDCQVIAARSFIDCPMSKNYSVKLKLCLKSKKYCSVSHTIGCIVHNPLHIICQSLLKGTVHPKNENYFENCQPRYI